MKTFPSLHLAPARLALLCTFLLAGSAAAAGGIYKWRDADGRIHFQDTPPPDGVAAKPLNVPDAAKKWANVEIQILPTTYRKYEVRGFSTDELTASLLAKTPIVDEQNHAWGGQCRWNIKWEFRYDKAAQRCAIASFNLRLISVIDVPTWVNRSAAPLLVQQAWDRYDRALRRHEEAHRNTGVAAIYEMARQIRAIGSYPDCAMLDQQISLVGNQVDADFRAKDKKFDDDTDHGRTQGVHY